MTSYFISLFSISLIYVLFGLGLNLHWGYAGLLNFGHVAFFAIGAYTSALLSLNGAPIAVGLFAGACMAAFAAYLVGFLTTRLKEDYLAIVMLTLAEIVRLVAVNSSWTGGPSGLPNIPAPFVDALGRTSRGMFLLMLVIAVVIALLLLSRLTRSEFGLALRAIRDDEVCATAVGKNIRSFKTKALVIGAILAGVAGAFYGMYVSYIVPDQFVPLVTFYAWVGIILGGRSHLGAALGTLVFMALLESTRFLSDMGVPITDAQVANGRLLIVGLVLIVLLRVRPQGLFPYKPTLPKQVRAEVQRTMSERIAASNHPYHEKIDA
ncbi:MAG: branched-chain amino acid ABC transporter permease [Rhizobiales bacterium]|nr:branched-chain amino acid ABC transporter permease [Hyphomicrobiales bacterium]